MMQLRFFRNPSSGIGWGTGLLLGFFSMSYITSVLLPVRYWLPVSARLDGGVWRKWIFASLFVGLGWSLQVSVALLAGFTGVIGGGLVNKIIELFPPHLVYNYNEVRFPGWRKALVNMGGWACCGLPSLFVYSWGLMLASQAWDQSREEGGNGVSFLWFQGLVFGVLLPLAESFLYLFFLNVMYYIPPRLPIEQGVFPPLRNNARVRIMNGDDSLDSDPSDDERPHMS